MHTNNKEYRNIIIDVGDTVYSNCDKRDLEKFLDFLLNKNTVFNIQYKYREFDDDKVYDEQGVLVSESEIGNYEYEITLEKEVSIFLLNIFDNLKIIFYDEEKQVMLNSFFKKVNERKEQSIYINEDSELQLRKSLFLPDEEELKEICYDIFRNKKRSDKKIEDNSKYHRRIAHIDDYRKIKSLRKVVKNTANNKV